MKRTVEGGVTVLEPQDEADRRILERLYADGVLDPGTTDQRPAITGTPMPELAYSPGQKRDNVGRFGSGGGGAPSAAPDAPSAGSNGGPGVAGITVEGFPGTKAIFDHFGAQMDIGFTKPGMGAQVKNQGQVVAERLKGEAEDKIGADLDAAFPAERLQALADKLPGGVGRGNTPGEQVADGVMATWAETAYDMRAPASVAVQLAVAQEFGTGVTPFIAKQMKEGPIPSFQKQVEEKFDQPVLRAAVRSMYDHTQKQLGDLGIAPGQGVGLTRGVGTVSAFKGKKGLSLNPASSWTTDEHIAEMFGDGAVLSMTVPRTRILSIPGNGSGAYKESEVIVLRGKGDQALGKLTAHD